MQPVVNSTPAMTPLSPSNPFVESTNPFEMDSEGPTSGQATSTEPDKEVRLLSPLLYYPFLSFPLLSFPLSPVFCFAVLCSALLFPLPLFVCGALHCPFKVV